MNSGRFPLNIRVHLVPSPFLGLAHAPIVETRVPALAVSSLDFSPSLLARFCLQRVQPASQQNMLSPPERFVTYICSNVETSLS